MVGLARGRAEELNRRHEIREDVTASTGRLPLYMCRVCYLALHLSDEPASIRTCKLGNMTSTWASALALALADGLPSTKHHTEYRAPTFRIPNTEHRARAWTFDRSDARTSILSCPVVSWSQSRPRPVSCHARTRRTPRRAAKSRQWTANSGQRTVDSGVQPRGGEHQALSSEDGLVRRGPTPLRTR